MSLSEILQYLAEWYHSKWLWKPQKYPNNPMILKTTITMKSLLSSKRSKALLGIGLIAIGIGAISKKVFSFPAGGCIKGDQELTVNKVINKFYI